MAYLPSTEAATLATKSDTAMVRSDISALGQRINRPFLTLGAGLIAMIGAVFVQSIL